MAGGAGPQGSPEEERSTSWACRVNGPPRPRGPPREQGKCGPDGNNGTAGSPIYPAI
ncbi:unnamed protein product [Strongylus vulgaris]|uniref:Uncharacterized protein n=1 Tax=Strongylus vulgaris TaxID=40348 RepID=A0A3P7KNL6_STRVU|nr:unnamed protein product [Strongylus vulgaris]